MTNACGAPGDCGLLVPLGLVPTFHQQVPHGDMKIYMYTAINRIMVATFKTSLNGLLHNAKKRTKFVDQLHTRAVTIITHSLL